MFFRLPTHGVAASIQNFAPSYICNDIKGTFPIPVWTTPRASSISISDANYIIDIAMEDALVFNLAPTLIQPQVRVNIDFQIS